jgi:hypothetical protein
MICTILEKKDIRISGLGRHVCRIEKYVEPNYLKYIEHATAG